MRFIGFSLGCRASRAPDSATSRLAFNRTLVLRPRRRRAGWSQIPDVARLDELRAVPVTHARRALSPPPAALVERPRRPALLGVQPRLRYARGPQCVLRGSQQCAANARAPAPRV